MPENQDDLPRSVRELLSLSADQAPPRAIDAAIRDNAQVGGTNLWVLVCAIVVASVGLNVNSAAVIIGAMLISPLMGPIIAIGYGAGIDDHALMRQSLRNLAVFVAISLLASTGYFLVTPLAEAHSELLARTSPSIWDVAIAFFGGAAGMIGLTRRGQGTLIPGVAIATALMPPLCTTGYGIATGQPEFFVGAFFLFLINCVFIGLATLAITRLLRLPRHAYPDERTQRRARVAIYAMVLLTLVPSIWMATHLVREEAFRSRADRVVTELNAAEPGLTVLARTIDARQRGVAVTVIGGAATEDLEARIETRLRDVGIDDATVSVRRVEAEGIDLAAISGELRSAAVRDAIAAVEARSTKLAEAETQLARLNTAIAELARVQAEIGAQLPAVSRAIVTGSLREGPDGMRRLYVLVALVDIGDTLPLDLERVRRWLRARLPGAEIEMLVGTLVEDPDAQPPAEARIAPPGAG
jgi:uncharacterized hydrophobic protein (TIGR00271 family)